MMSSLYLLTFLFNSFHIIYCQNGSSIYVNTTRGQLVGYHLDNGNDSEQIFYGQADVFLGIPFALPPIGALRYKVIHKWSTFCTIFKNPDDPFVLET